MPSTITVLDAELALPALRVPARGGPIATSGQDEDVVTLAVEACLPLLERSGGDRPDALVLATVSAPMAEGGVAQTIAEALDLQGPRPVLELGGTLCSGIQGLLVASALLADGCEHVLLVAADRRRDAEGRAIGDGSIALLLGAGEAAQGVLTITVGASRTELLRDRWRTQHGLGVIEADRSLTTAQRPTPTAGLTRYGVLDAPLPRVGMLGTGHFLLRAILDTPETGDDLELEASASGVTQHLTLRGGPALARTSASLRARIAAGIDGPIAATSAADGAFDPYASQARSWRERAMDLRLEGQCDPATGEVLFPPLPSASAAGLVPYRLARTGRVLTQTRDHVYPVGGPITMAVIEVDGGGRVYCQSADGATLEIGDRVELVLRRLHDGGGLPHYFVKARPIRDAAALSIP
jgi:uncharacterized OB-fold protein